MPDLTESAGALALLGVAVSVVTLFVCALVVPALVVRAPVDYFTHRRRRESLPRPVGLRWVLALLKNLAGAVLVLAGVAMLVLPGQGLVTIVAGLLVLDFPGKYALERRLVRLPWVRRSLNWLRRRAGVPPFHESA